MRIRKQPLKLGALARTTRLMLHVLFVDGVVQSTAVRTTYFRCSDLILSRDMSIEGDGCRAYNVLQ